MSQKGALLPIYRNWTFGNHFVLFNLTHNILMYYFYNEFKFKTISEHNKFFSQCKRGPLAKVVII